LENLSDEAVVLQWKRNPYYQAFCGLKAFQQRRTYVKEVKSVRAKNTPVPKCKEKSQGQESIETP